MMFVRVPFVEKATGAVHRSPRLPTCRPPAEPYLSSLSVLDDHVQQRYGSVVVKDISFMIHVLSQHLYVHYWSWNGRLHLSASYNEVYYTSAYMEKWLAALKNNVLENLNSPS
jgi:hypothetical protein